jgi:hypothetical protein
MGEARNHRRVQRRLLGCSPFWGIDIIQPDCVVRSPAPDHLSIIAAAVQAHSRRPAPLCSCCSREFADGAAPPKLFVLRPLFPNGGRYRVTGGSICPECSARSDAEIAECVEAYVRETNPGIQRVQVGRG